MGFIKNLLYLLSNEYMLKINRINTEYESLYAVQAKQGDILEKIIADYNVLNTAFKDIRVEWNDQNTIFENQKKLYTEQKIICDRQKASFEKQKIMYEGLRTSHEEQKASYDRLWAAYECQNATYRKLSGKCESLEINLGELKAGLERLSAAEGGQHTAADYRLSDDDIQRMIAALIKSRELSDLLADYREWDVENGPSTTVFGKAAEPGRAAESGKTAESKEMKNAGYLFDPDKPIVPRISAVTREDWQDSNTRESVRDNPFSITKNRDIFLFSADDLECSLFGFCNTELMDQFFGPVPEDNLYKKMFERYKKNIRKAVEKADLEDDIEDVLSAIITVVQNDLLKKIIVSLYRGIKSGRDGFEKALLETVNEYLQDNGFYTRDDIQTGSRISDKDFEDMEFIKDDSNKERRSGEITEIELYPYYLNFIDESNIKGSIHTQGMMVITA